MADALLKGSEDYRRLRQIRGVGSLPDGHEFIDEQHQRLACDLGHGRVVDLGRELRDTVDPLRRNDAELGQVRSQGTGQHRALADKEFAHPVQHEHSLGLARLHAHEPHAGSRDRLSNSLGVSGVGFVALNARLQIGRRHEPHLMAEPEKLAGPVVGGRAGLHADGAGWQCAEVVEHLGATQLHLREWATVWVDRVHLKDLLGDFETDDANLHRTAPLGLPAQTAIMPRRGRGAGAVHPQRQAPERVPEAGDLLQLTRGAGRDRDMAQSLQLRQAEIGAELQISCAVTLQAIARRLPTPITIQ
jgi:hypothetical protein